MTELVEKRNITFETYVRIFLRNFWEMMSDNNTIVCFVNKKIRKRINRYKSINVLLKRLR
jgi:hypothetical protein